MRCWIVLAGWVVIMCGCLLKNADGQQSATLSEFIRPRVEALRNLEFRAPITHQSQSVKELQEVLQQELARLYPGNALDVLEKRLLKFGFVASPIDLQAQLTRMYSQQIAGYYDPHTNQMVVIEKSPDGLVSGALFPIEILSQWLIESSGVSMAEIVLAHELTHAVQDQHFDLATLPIEALDPEDATSAVKALIEGDATVVMFDYMLAPQGLDVLRVPELSDSLHAWLENPLMRGISLFQPVPRYLMDNLIFPYVYGFDLVVQLKQRGGWEAVNRAYQDIPTSTEQVLHPEKYLDERDLPTHISLPDLPDTLQGWHVIEQNTLGELNIRILLDGYLSSVDAQTGGAGWDGDRFAFCEQVDTGQLFLAWLTAWDSEQESKEFFHKIKIMTRTRYGDELPVERFSSANVSMWKIEGGEVLLEQRGPDVLLLDGMPAGELDTLRAHFWNSRVERR